VPSEMLVVSLSIVTTPPALCLMFALALRKDFSTSTPAGTPAPMHVAEPGAMKLPEEQAGRWYDLLSSGRLTQLEAGRPAPDRFVYRVLGPGLELTAAEQELPDDVRGLFDETLRDR